MACAGNEWEKARGRGRERDRRLVLLRRYRNLRSRTQTNGGLNGLHLLLRLLTSEATGTSC